MYVWQQKHTYVYHQLRSSGSKSARKGYYLPNGGGYVDGHGIFHEPLSSYVWVRIALYVVIYIYTVV